MMRMTIDVTEAKIGRSTKKWAKRIGDLARPPRPRAGRALCVVAGAPRGSSAGRFGYSLTGGRSLRSGVTLAPGRTRVRPLMTIVSSPFRPSRTTR